MTASRPFAALLQQAAHRPPARAAIAGAHDSHALESALEARSLGLVEPVLVGDGAAIKQCARERRLDLAGVAVENQPDEAAIALRAAELAQAGEIGLIVKGQIHTDALMRALLAQERGLRTGRRASHAFLLETPGEHVLVSDAALNVAPDEAILLDIARNAVSLALAVGMAPRAVLLSASETAFAALPSSMRAAAVAETLQAEFPAAAVAGPLALDVAIAPEAAKRKNIRHPAAGCANILVVPNIETGNALYKLMVWRLGATAAGVISGLRLPVALASRADPPAARLASMALAKAALAAAAQAEAAP